MQVEQPCPFCGANGELIERHNPMSKWKWSVDCVSSTCGMSGPVESSSASAIATWNTRFEASLPPSAPVDREAIIEFAMQYGPKCRDCGDEDGVCPMSGLPCGDKRKGVAHVVDALLYGAKHGYIATPSVLAESTSNDCLLVAEGWQEEVGEDAREALAWADRSVEYQFGGYAFTQSFQPNAEHIATLARLASAALSRTHGGIFGNVCPNCTPQRECAGCQKSQDGVRTDA